MSTERNPHNDALVEGPAPRERHYYAVLDVCGWLHGAITGSGETFDARVLERWADWLRWRIEKAWERRPGKTHEYDTAVMDLAIAVLREHRTHVLTADEPADDTFPEPFTNVGLWGSSIPDEKKP